MPFRITWSRRDGVKEKGERLREKGRLQREREERKKESALWIAGGTASNSSNCASDFLQSQHMAD